MQKREIESAWTIEVAWEIEGKRTDLSNISEANITWPSMRVSEVEQCIKYDAQLS